MGNKNVKTETLEYWVEQYSDQLYSWAYYKTHSRETAQDLVQETFLAVTKGYAKCKNRSNPKAWLFSILNNKIFDFYRKSAREWQQIEPDDVKTCNQTVDGLFDSYGNWTNEGQQLYRNEEIHLLDRPDFNARLEKCLDKLPNRWKFAIVAKYVNNKKGTEICTTLGISAANYWQVLRRAKIFLRNCLQKYWKE